MTFFQEGAGEDQKLDGSAKWPAFNSKMPNLSN